MPLSVIVIRFTVCDKVLRPKQKGEEGSDYVLFCIRYNRQVKHTVYKPLLPQRSAGTCLLMCVVAPEHTIWPREASTNARKAPRTEQMNKQANKLCTAGFISQICLHIYKLEMYQQLKHTRCIFFSTVHWHELIMILDLIEFFIEWHKMLTSAFF